MQPGYATGEIPRLSDQVREIRPMIGELPLVAVDAVRDFDEFYGPTRQSVGRALAVTLRDVDLATDSVDEALVRAYQRWEQVGRLDNPAGWVYRVGLNHARSRLRRLLRRVPAPATESVEFTVADPAIDDAIAELSHDHRAVVVCRLLLGWSEAQTADALAIRPGTVKSRLHRATNQLERSLHHLRPEES
ncbi:MAG: sigma factor-like helix-turn-helix DNA-binding protein [Ilumatobacteraceae bacterium]